jgi:beta-xylosidase
MPDQGDGTYRNPVLFADYSDPDAIRVGRDFYLVSSSFHCTPGLPILHSFDLVNWEIINHALPTQVPADHFSAVRHGEGVWAPAIRYHAGKFSIYYPDPDFGIYVVTATDPAGAWSAPILVKAGQGIIDPCPFWDDDGQGYLIHGWAKSRSGVNNRLTLHRLAPDGASVTDAGAVVIDADKMPGWTTLEGPKLYKRHGYYYIFAPAGGVTRGYQAVFRSKNIYGPYENRIVLAQGRTEINGPHQGAWVDTPTGQDWFLHFQDRGAFGRVVHLEPMLWRDDDWPVIGSDPQGTGKGEPVLTHAKPDVGADPAGTRMEEPVLPHAKLDLGRSYPVAVPQTSDEFEGRTLGPVRTSEFEGKAIGAVRTNESEGGALRTATTDESGGKALRLAATDEVEGKALGLQWQWNANPRPEWASLTARPGFLRLASQPAPGGNLYNAPNLLLQKFPAPAFTVTTKLEMSPAGSGESAGLIVFGYDYAWIGLRSSPAGNELVQVAFKRPADHGANGGSGAEVGPGGQRVNEASGAEVGLGGRARPLAPRVQEASATIPTGPIYLRVIIDPQAQCLFSYSTDGSAFTPLGPAFTASVDRWIGAKVGLFASADPSRGLAKGGYADFAWFRVTP